MKHVVFLILSDILVELSVEIGLAIFEEFHTDGTIIKSAFDLVADFAAGADGVDLLHLRDVAHGFVELVEGLGQHAVEQLREDDGDAENDQEEEGTDHEQ